MLGRRPTPPGCHPLFVYGQRTVGEAPAPRFNVRAYLPVPKAVLSCAGNFDVIGGAGSDHADRQGERRAITAMNNARSAGDAILRCLFKQQLDEPLGHQLADRHARLRTALLSNLDIYGTTSEKEYYKFHSARGKRSTLHR